MKVTRLIFGILAAVTLPLLSCTREIVEVTPPQESEGQSLHVSIGSDFTTKSALTNTGASQHIEHMYAYLFREETPGDGNFKCFYAVDMDWTPVEGTGISDFSYRISRDAGLQAMGDRLIKVLVVAVDNNRGNYRFPVSADGQKVDTGSHVSMQELEGMPFDDVKAVLAADVAGVNGTTGTPEANKAWAMAHTELFSGSTEAVPANTPVIEVTIDRCVAGVLCYLTDIPYLVKSGEEDSKIQSIELRLNSRLDLNTSMTLGQKTTGSAFLYEGESKPVDGVVIASVDVSMYSERQSDSGQQGGMLYIPATDDGTVKTLENSILFGAYMVPIDVSSDVDDKADNSTLSIYLKGGENSKWESDPYRIRNASGTPTQPGNRSFIYSLLANSMYAIGTKPTSGDTEGDRPASLAGDELLLNVVDWVDDINPDVQFPSYSLGASFVSNISPDYIYDCIGGITLTAAVLPSASKNGWSITPVNTGDGTDWIRFRVVEADGTPGEWRQTTYNRPVESSDEAVQIEIMFEDYVKENYIMGRTDLSIAERIEDLESDYRTCQLMLKTDGESSVDYLTINQYNAITAPVIKHKLIGSDEYLGYVGFARNDLLLPEWDDKAYEEKGYSYTGWGFSFNDPWGYMGRDDSEDDGEFNCSTAFAFWKNKDDTERLNNYYHSALYRGYREWTDFNSDDYANRIWFTPSRSELKGFFNDVVSPLASFYTDLSDGIIPVINMKYNKYYWSSSAHSTDWARASWTFKIPGNSDGEYGDRDGMSAFIRQARNFQ